MAASDKDSPEVRNESGHSADQGPDRKKRSDSDSGPGDKSVPDASPATANQANEGHRTLIRDRSERPAGLFARGEIIGDRYRILDSLGRGGMGEVWKAFDLKLRVEVALKSLRRDLFADEERLELLRQEVKLARDVVSPNVCRVFDLEVIDGQELVSMEYIDGETLEGLLTKQGPLEVRRAGEIASQFLAGLTAIHESGLIHRDLKPENLMITRTGRVVIMDFGVAKAASESSGTVAGTLAYMAPEQARGEVIDTRADVYASGIILAEMTNPDGFSLDMRRKIWEGARKKPPQLPDGPWHAVLTRALAERREERPKTAWALARALEEISLRVDGAEEKHPYPGLASFTEESAEYFFGREAEVEALWKKLQRPHLLGLIGPSGVGKSSFLRAGLIPAKPEGWRHVISHPSDAPFHVLAQSLVQELLGDADAMRELLRFEDPETAVRVIARWRKDAGEAVVILDQFEELFTLNPPEVQERFSALLGRLPLEADVRVLLSMRDDFLFRCHAYPALAPILSELTLLGPPAGMALRRALVQPALACGYRFEDKELVEEMIAELAEERGALPMLAFSAAQLWERRDRESGTLTREAYQAIGGVGGALAQHAEATLERLGDAKRDLVREVFRNMVTAEGTRATREIDELLSVFEDREGAREVVAALIDARLLTTYEAEDVSGEGRESRHVEIVHESLLDAWPRLVRWRTQDADGAQLRDQLRQAARLWEERDRSEDHLWSGSAYFDFRAWRERYPGGLSDTEEAFAAAMVSRANRQRRRRRIAVTVAFITLAVVLGVIGLLWRQSVRAGAAAENARQEAVDEARRAEASKLLALGRLEIDEAPTAALAYALASVELVDDESARRFALEALGKGPTAFSLGNPGGRSNAVAFSPSLEWLAVGSLDGKLTLVSPSGREREIAEFENAVRWAAFSPDGDRLATLVAPGTLAVFTVPDGQLVRRVEITTHGIRVIATTREVLDLTAEPPGYRVRAFSLEEATEREIGRLPTKEFDQGAVNGDATRFAYSRGRILTVVSFGGAGSAKPRIVGEHPAEITAIQFHPDGRTVASADESGNLYFWNLDSDSRTPSRVFGAFRSAKGLVFDPSGSWLAVASSHGGAGFELFSLEAPAGAASIRLKDPGQVQAQWLAFDSVGHWLATTDLKGVTLWPLGGSYPATLGPLEGATGLAVAPDGGWVARANMSGDLWVWPLEGNGPPRRISVPPKLYGFPSAHPDNRRVLFGTDNQPSPVFLLSTTGGDHLELSGFKSTAMTTAISPDGRLAAAAGGAIRTEDGVVRIWNLESGEVQVLEPPRREFIAALAFLPDSRQLVSAGATRVLLWDLETGTAEVLREWEKADWGSLALSGDGRWMISFRVDSSGATRNIPVLHDLVSGEQRVLVGFGEHVGMAALDETGERAAIFDLASGLQVGPLTGEPPHLLLGDELIWGVAFLPGKERVVSAGKDGRIRIWPIPEGRPFHTLPYDELLERLRSLTNYRVVEDANDPTGYRLEAEPFRGWTEVPTW